MLGIIDRAQAEIRLAGYSFTSPDVATALVRAKARGVDVRVVLDEKANQNRKSQVAINVLTARDIPVRLNGRYAALHDKFIVADGRTVETGSVNYTRAGTRNQYPQVTGNHNQRYAQNSPDLRQKEIIKITNKVFIPAFCVDKFNAFACSGRTRPRRSELKN